MKAAPFVSFGLATFLLGTTLASAQGLRVSEKVARPPVRTSITMDGTVSEIEFGGNMDPLVILQYTPSPGGSSDRTKTIRQVRKTMRETTDGVGDFLEGKLPEPVAKRSQFGLDALDALNGLAGGEIQRQSEHFDRE